MGLIIRFVDDSFTISEEVKRMTPEERRAEAARLEEEARKEREKIRPEDRKTLKVVGM